MYWWKPISASASRLALSRYRDACPVCRPIGISVRDRARSSPMCSSVGLEYDVKNITDMLRFLVPLPIPTRWRRRMLSMGSGQPTRTICSTLIAQASKRALSDPAAHRGGQRLFAQGNPAHPASFPVRAARLRPVTLFRRGQADDRARLRLQDHGLGDLEAVPSRSDAGSIPAGTIALLRVVPESWPRPGARTGSPAACRARCGTSEAGCTRRRL